MPAVVGALPSRVMPCMVMPWLRAVPPPPVPVMEKSPGVSVEDKTEVSDLKRAEG